MLREPPSRKYDRSIGRLRGTRRHQDHQAITLARRQPFKFCQKQSMMTGRVLPSLLNDIACPVKQAAATPGPGIKNAFADGISIRMQRLVFIPLLSVRTKDAVRFLAAGSEPWRQSTNTIIGSVIGYFGAFGQAFFSYTLTGRGPILM